MILISPSAVKNYRECVRKWALTKIAGLKTPSTKSQELGKDVDDNQLQPFLRDGRPFDFTRVTKGFESEPGLSAQIAASGMAWYPQPKHRGLEVQKHFVFMSPSKLAFGYHGYKDVWLPYGGAPGFDNELATVSDFKTTKSIRKWALTEEELRTDPQAVIYGVNAILETKSKEVNLNWIYLQTEGARTALPTQVTVSTDELAEQLRLIETDAKKMFAVLKDAPGASDAAQEFALTLPPNPQACDNYGGCPFRHLCNLGPEDFFTSISGPPRGGASRGADDEQGVVKDMDLFAKLKKKNASSDGAAASSDGAAAAASSDGAVATDAVAAAGMAAALAAPEEPVLGVNPPMPDGTPEAPPVGSVEAKPTAKKRGPGRPKKTEQAEVVAAEAALEQVASSFTVPELPVDEVPTLPAGPSQAAIDLAVALEKFLKAVQK